MGEIVKPNYQLKQLAVKTRPDCDVIVVVYKPCKHLLRQMFRPYPCIGVDPVIEGSMQTLYKLI